MTSDQARVGIRDLVPPVVIRLVHRLRNRRPGSGEWEYAQEGWEAASRRLRGWDVESVARLQVARWSALASAAVGSGPLSLNHEAADLDTTSVGAHNTVISFAYVASLATHTRVGDVPLSILDWGGGIGQYWLVTRAALPDVALDYHVVDVPAMCHAGRGLGIDVTFHEEATTYVERTFDLVFASSSLQYVRNWQDVAADMAHMAGRYVYVTRVPVVARAASFPVIQRPYIHGYDTEYVGWFFNRGELVGAFESSGLQLVREFLIDERPYVPGAPEQAHYAGFLFRPST